MKKDGCQKSHHSRLIKSAENVENISETHIGVGTTTDFLFFV